MSLEAESPFLEELGLVFLVPYTLPVSSLHWNLTVTGFAAVEFDLYSTEAAIQQDLVMPRA